MKVICGVRRTGSTGVQWLCIRSPHGAENAEYDEQYIEATTHGTAWPDSMRHHMVAVEVDAAGAWRQKR